MMWKGSKTINKMEKLKLYNYKKEKRREEREDKTKLSKKRVNIHRKN